MRDTLLETQREAKRKASVRRLEEEVCVCVGGNSIKGIITSQVSIIESVSVNLALLPLLSPSSGLILIIPVKLQTARATSPTLHSFLYTQTEISTLI